MNILKSILLLSLSITTLLPRVSSQPFQQVDPDERAAGLLYLIDKKAEREESNELEMEALKQLLTAADQAGIDLESTEEVQGELKRLNDNGNNFTKYWNDHHSLSKCVKRNIFNNANALVPLIIQGGYYGYKAYQLYQDPNSYKDRAFFILKSGLKTSGVVRNFMKIASDQLTPTLREYLGSAGLPLVIAATFDNLLPRNVLAIEGPNESMGKIICMASTCLLCLAPHVQNAYDEWYLQDQPPLLYSEKRFEEKVLQESKISSSELDRIVQKRIDEYLAALSQQKEKEK